MKSKADKGFMALAISLAKKADPYPNPRVGAVLVKDGKRIGCGYHKGSGKPHAEIEAIEDSKRKTQNPRAPSGATLYVTLEPCSHTAKRTPPCTKAIIAEGISRVVFAMEDPNPLVDGAEALGNAGIETIGPFMEKEARAINKRYIANISKPPIVTIKMAMSADGKTATRTGDSRWISGQESRDLVHRMRADSDAVMVGAGTVAHDDPSLTSHGKGKDPYRIIIDGNLHIPINSKVVRENRDHKTIIAISGRAKKNKKNAEKIGSLARAGVMVFVCGERAVDLRMLIAGLSAMGMKRIMIEGGSGLNAKALEAGIVDRLLLFVAPMLIGGLGAKPVVGGLGIERIDEAIALSKPKMKKIGDDLLLEYMIKKKGSSPTLG